MNKSKKLCELLGIKPKYYNQILEEVGWSMPMDNLDQIEVYAKKTAKNSTLTLKQIDEFNMPVYPDMHDPVNFVQLLEIVCKGNFIYKNGYKFETDNPVKELIIQTVADIDCANCSCEKKNVEKWKQAAQAVEWKWQEESILGNKGKKIANG